MEISEAIHERKTTPYFGLTLEEASIVAQNTANALMATHLVAPTNPKSVATMALKGPVRFMIPKNKMVRVATSLVSDNGGDKTKSRVDGNEEDNKKQPKRKTRWGPDPRDDPIVRRGLALALQTRAEQIAAQLESGFLDINTNEATRSPSPPPVYDTNGQRTNTREGRRREQLEIERREAIGECMRLNPAYKPPAGYKPVFKEAKLFIPVKDYPGYNFIGLILGPRGNTQKRMEQETGTKIAIRGRGAIKEGKRPLQTGHQRDAECAFDDLHVHITADSFDKVDAAVALVEPLLMPVDEVQNQHKRKQLKELAEMNGTMRDFTKVACTTCGELGHLEWQCCKDTLVTFQSKVLCAICGDGSHPTNDCPKKSRNCNSTQGNLLDSEYKNFLEEINNGTLGVISSTPPSSLATNVGRTGQFGMIVLQNQLGGTETKSQTKKTFLVKAPQAVKVATSCAPQHIPTAWTNYPPHISAQAPAQWTGGIGYVGGYPPRPPSFVPAMNANQGHHVPQTAAQNCPRPQYNPPMTSMGNGNQLVSVYPTYMVHSPSGLRPLVTTTNSPTPMTALYDPRWQGVPQRPPLPTGPPPRWCQPQMCPQQSNTTSHTLHPATPGLTSMQVRPPMPIAPRPTQFQVWNGMPPCAYPNTFQPRPPPGHPPFSFQAPVSSVPQPHWRPSAGAPLVTQVPTTPTTSTSPQSVSLKVANVPSTSSNEITSSSYTNGVPESRPQCSS